MTTSLRIAVADDEVVMREFLQKVLPYFGHEVVAVAENGKELVELCEQTRPDLIITDIEMPEMDGLTAVRKLTDAHGIPVIVVSAHHQDDLVRRALREQILAYLVKPIKRDDLQPAIALAMQRFREFEALRKQADDLKQALDDRKLIERAKGVLMTRSGLSEPDAFKRLQLLSSQRNLKMVEIAQLLVSADEAMSP